MSIQSFKDLVAWQEAMNLVSMIYTITRQYPKEEMFGLTSQTRRAVVSIPSNIAEGNGRNSIKDYIHFLAIAHGSLSELETQLIIAERNKMANPNDIQQIYPLIRRVGALINGLKLSLEKKSKRDSKEE